MVRKAPQHHAVLAETVLANIEAGILNEFVVVIDAPLLVLWLEEDVLLRVQVILPHCRIFKARVELRQQQLVSVVLAGAVLGAGMPSYPVEGGDPESQEGGLHRRLGHLPAHGLIVGDERPKAHLRLVAHAHHSHLHVHWLETKRHLLLLILRVKGSILHHHGPEVGHHLEQRHIIADSNGRSVGAAKSGQEAEGTELPCHH
mmetsp:Transcript_120181/g.291553  ORF Transcript_120181/g.291553 Transcript_120181/m.291553 type:complete len:202 (+) Transcript_120181:114-719(+)